jgi:anti-sigma B factor antagonist
MVFIELVRQKGGDIKLAAMKERVFSVFDLLGFPVLFQIFPTVDEAVEAFPVVA